MRDLKKQMNLNPAQKSAVEHEGSPLCIIAGAGTGKTRVLTQRIIHLIQKRDIDPERILAITFTEKGTAEMHERLLEEIPGASEMWIHTFHGLCNKIMAENPLETGIPTDVKLCDAAELYLLLRDNFKKLELEHFRSKNDPTSGLQTLISTFGKLKTENVLPHQLDEIVRQQIVDKENAMVETKSKTKIDGYKEEIAKLSELARVYHIYQEILQENKVVEYGDLITSVLNMLKNHPSIAVKYQEQFDYVLVDEYQDTNTIQNQLIDILVQQHRNITVVGDDDQAIFRFQGASLKNILQFSEKYPDAKKVILTENYRSNKTVLDSSYALMQNGNPHRLEVKEGINKKLEAKGSVEDHKIKVEVAGSIFGQYESVVKQIENYKLSHPEISYADIAILYRNHSSGSNMADHLKRASIPHLVHGGSGLFDTFEVHSLKCILQSLMDIEDSTMLFRVMTLPIWNIPLGDSIRISQYAKFNHKTIAQVIDPEVFEEKLKEGEIKISEEGEENIKRLNTVLTEIRELAKAETATTLLFHILEKTGYMRQYLDTQNIENIQKIHNINTVFEVAEKFTNLNPKSTAIDFLRHLEMLEKGGQNPPQAEIDVKVDAVQLMTIHKSKGLEYKIVFLIDVAEGKLPGRNISSPIKLDVGEQTDREGFIAEERRLMYVGMTRAKERLHILCATKAPGRKTEMKPSRFIAELPQESIIVTQEESDQTEQILEKLLTKPKPRALDQELLRQLTQQVKLSATQIGSYLACPLNYMYKFIYSIPGKPGTAMNFGSKIHEALYFLHQEIKEGQLPTKDDLIKYWKDNWSDEGYFDLQQAAELKKHGEEVLIQYYDTYSTKFIAPLFLEQDFTYTINVDDEEVRLKGSIDRIDPVPDHEDPNAVHIIDYKTGKAKTANQIKGLRAERRLYYQLLFYTVVAKESLGLNPVRTSFYFIEENKWIEFNFTEEELEEFRQEIKTVRRSISNCQFDPTPDMQLCKWCDYRSLCPTIKEQE